MQVRWPEVFPLRLMFDSPVCQVVLACLLLLEDNVRSQAILWLETCQIPEYEALVSLPPGSFGVVIEPMRLLEIQLMVKPMVNNWNAICPTHTPYPIISLLFGQLLHVHSGFFWAHVFVRQSPSFLSSTLPAAFPPSYLPACFCGDNRSSFCKPWNCIEFLP